MELALALLKAFVVGGLICVIGQLLIDYTHLTNGKILVIFLVAGAILQAFGLYEYLIKFAGAGASVPISGFGYALVKGAVESVKEMGPIGAFVGGLKATAIGISTAIVFGYAVALIFKPRTKEM
ncbi:MAG: stage V sporulation protein AE [Clostridia bacterium]|nr:stage V sporulation protein AE [Clostridia bacterium]